MFLQIKKKLKIEFSSGNTSDFNPWEMAIYLIIITTL